MDRLNHKAMYKNMLCATCPTPIYTHKPVRVLNLPPYKIIADHLEIRLIKSVSRGNILIPCRTSHSGLEQAITKQARIISGPVLLLPAFWLPKHLL
ncbi:MAG: hypothetical protein JWQ14_270 [Adhaeribacter sp.]|jgi:hypothetical protein|nr:hypothetical protein [Adhaeribacter sp.]